MPIQKINKDEIIAKSIEKFREKGYHKTSMEELAKECGLQKGSFYYYFDSKEALMKASLLAVLEYFRERVFSIAYNEDLAPKERLRKMGEKMMRITMKNNHGCFIGNVTLETANQVPAFQELLRTYFEEWTKALAHIYESKYQQEYAYQLGQQSVMEIEGAIMIMKLTANEQLLKDCYERIIHKI